MTLGKLTALCAWLVVVGLLCANSIADELKPLMVQIDGSVFGSDFSQPDGKLADFVPRKSTQWAIEDGVLRGREASKNYQLKKGYGKNARVIVRPGPADNFAVRCSFRFLHGEENPVVPFIEFGHSICRFRFGSKGLVCLADKQSIKVAEYPEVIYEPGKWYHILAEIKGQDVVLQFRDGPVCFATHPSFAKRRPGVAKKSPGFGGPRYGMVEIDNISIWSCKEAHQPGWEKKRATFQLPEPQDWEYRPGWKARDVEHTSIWDPNTPPRARSDFPPYPSQDAEYGLPPKEFLLD